jgi:hypothetical protein
MNGLLNWAESLRIMPPRAGCSLRKSLPKMEQRPKKGIEHSPQRQQSPLGGK